MSKKILLIESFVAINDTLSLLLNKKNYKIDSIVDFKKAKKALEENFYDFIICDASFFDKELAKIINNQENKQTKTILLSLEKHDEKRELLFQNGIIECFSKKTPLEELACDIDKLIKKINKNVKNSILIVDDSSFIRNSMRSILSVKNYTIFLAKDVKDAINILEEKRIDLIFSDLEMPNISGIEFIKIVKKNSSLKNIPILVLSSSQNKQDYSNALKYGAIDFIRKPFVIEEILLKADLHIQHSKQIQEIQKKAKELEEYKRVLNESDIVSKTDSKGIITYANQQFIDISGYTKEELLGKKHTIVRHPDVDPSVFKDMWKHIKEKKTYKNIIKNKKKDGSAYYVDATISPILDLNGKVKEIIGVRHDITDIMNPKKQLFDDLKYMKNPVLILLEIANYNLFKEFYSESIMNKFEDEFAKKSLDYFPDYSQLKKVYNLGNGLFAFLKNHDIKSSYIDICLNEVIKNIKEKGIEFRGNIYDIEVSFSYSTEKKHIYDDVIMGIKYAIENNINIVYANNFYRRTQIEARKKLRTIQMIKDALAFDNSKFESYFQGIVDNKTNKIVKYESLVRLKNKKEEILTPYHFLELSKKTGYYTSITKNVINNSFKALSYTNKDISINLSATDIENQEIRNILLELITKKEYKSRVTFELLEDENINDFDLIKDFISLAKMLGDVKISIDDFGAGYSNFKRLLDFQPDFLKIDGSLIKNIKDDNLSRHVVESIILFSKKENIKTVAEFVETKEIFEIIKQMGIDYSQGYYFHKPQKLY